MECCGYLISGDGPPLLKPLKYFFLDLQAAYMLIYEALLAFLKEACDAQAPNQRKVGKTLDGYLISMSCESVVAAVVGSLECRKRLLELATKLDVADDPQLRTALRADEERIATLLVSIFHSNSDEEAVRCLEGDSAQYFLDVVQDILDRGFLLTQEHSRMARRIIRKLSEACDKLPSSLFMTGVSGREELPTFGGGYGDIYRASHENKPVALKRLRHFLRGSDLRRIRLKFCREALVWKDLHHPHILRFLGIDRDSFPSTFCMVSPWMEHGTVVNFLEVHGHITVDKLLYEIAQGLEYLHSRNIVHGDLRGANILIKEDWSACLADFGLSSFSDANSSTSTRGGSLCWMAPELLDPDRFGCKFARTPATDVYAFGCVCFELYTGRPPFSNLPEPAALMKVISGERQERPSGPPEMSDVLWHHVTEFWAESPIVRPSTRLVVQNMVWPTQNFEHDSPSGHTTPDDTQNSLHGELLDPQLSGSLRRLLDVLPLSIRKPSKSTPPTITSDDAFNVVFDNLTSSPQEMSFSDLHSARRLSVSSADSHSVYSDEGCITTDLRINTVASPSSVSLPAGELGGADSPVRDIFPRSASPSRNDRHAQFEDTASRVSSWIYSKLKRQLAIRPFHRKKMKANTLDALIGTEKSANRLSGGPCSRYQPRNDQYNRFPGSRSITLDNSSLFSVENDKAKAATSPKEASQFTFQPRARTKAKALCAYQARLANEISFMEGAILDIIYEPGKWCHAIKADGTTGLVQSSCLQILTGVGPALCMPVDSACSNQDSQNYKYKAKAWIAHTADPFDKYELSFLKDDIIDIIDPTGMWWKARKADGTIGVVRSNHFRIL